jgi:hypothetical protein
MKQLLITGDMSNQLITPSRHFPGFFSEDPAGEIS